jgi:NAD(P)H-dependent FMN reductase
MKTAIISASHRKKSRSARAAQWIAGALEQTDMQYDYFNLAEIELPFWNDDFWNPDSAAMAEWKPYSERLHSCDSLIVVSPEWAGMIPPKLTNFLLLCSRQELSYKPTLLVGISAGPSGTYPIAQLRMSASKNNQMIYLPDHLIVRNAESFFAPVPEQLKESCQDEEGHLNQRLRFNLIVLRTLARDLTHLRSNLNLKKFAYGL